MGQPAVVAGDRVTGSCAVHQIPNPATGAPQPAPSPLPFSAPLTTSLATTVVTGGKAAAVQGSSGLNSPAHVGLHGTDPFFAPLRQEGEILAGSATVLLEGRPAARTGSAARLCATPGQVSGSQTSVLIGG